MSRPSLVVLVLAAGVVRSASAQPPQPPQTPPKNLQVLAKDTARPALIQRMREFSFALGVRCQYCHAGGDGVSFDGVVFESDEKVAKQKARAMMRMIETINTTLLPQLPGRSQPAVAVDCVTCHRGLAVPKTIETVLLDAVARDGAAAAVRRYRDLRAKDTLTGRWDFDEWRVNEVARILVERKNPDAAIALLEMNGEFYPASTAIDLQLGELYAARGEAAKALARFKAALEKDPNNARAKRMIAELEAKKN
jgi:tetratricopeptide (TPR) repeat protein